MLASGMPLVLVEKMASRLAMLQHLLDQGALDFQILGDGFENPVTGLYFCQVVLEVSGGDQCFCLGRKKSSGPLLERRFQSA